MTKLESVLDTIARNLRLDNYDNKVVMVPYEHLRMLNRKYFEKKAAIVADRHLTNEGKEAATIAARAARDKAINEWHEARLKGLDADLLQQRAALMTQTERPDQRRVDLMAAELVKFTPRDRAVLYGSATDEERRVLEAASAAAGRLPNKSENGTEWLPLLDPEMVDAAVLDRATAANPTAAAKLRELVEIRATQTTVTGVALSEI